jgi:uncharacterized protein YjiK
MLLIFVLFIIGCSNDKPKLKSPDGYDLNKPEIINLSRKIDQISGIVYSAADNSLYAIDDDNGDLYNITPTKKPEVKKWKFGEKNDYEDLAIVDSTVYILESSGRIFSFPFRFPITGVKEYKLELAGFNEFETLYYDSSLQRLILLCKECEEDKKKSVSAYAFDILSDSFAGTPVLEVKRKDLEKTLDDKVSRLKASAGAIDPITGNIFIISSINKLLIVVDKQHNVKEVYELDPGTFGQPEGICFAPDGTLFISNEASGDKKADILIFKKQ